MAGEFWEMKLRHLTVAEVEKFLASQEIPSSTWESTQL